MSKNTTKPQWKAPPPAWSPWDENGEWRPRDGRSDYLLHGGTSIDQELNGVPSSMFWGYPDQFYEQRDPETLRQLLRMQSLPNNVAGLQAPIQDRPVGIAQLMARK